MGELNLFPHAYTSRNLKDKRQQKNNLFLGFTLIELLVVITMVGVLTSFLFLFLNPFKQLGKAKDAQRVQNLKQVNNALDTYYNDKNCYPLSLSFGNSSSLGSAYIQKVPEDPDCAVGGSCYAYVTDKLSNCPQWNVLFAKVYLKATDSISCPLEQLSNCVPSNYIESGYNYCVLSGKVDCTYLNSIALPINAGPQVTPTPTPIPTATPGPTATPTPTPSCSKDFSCTGSPLRCNVISPAGSGQYCASNCNGICP